MYIFTSVNQLLPICVVFVYMFTGHRSVTATSKTCTLNYFYFRVSTRKLTFRRTRVIAKLKTVKEVVKVSPHLKEIKENLADKEGMLEDQVK